MKNFFKFLGIIALVTVIGFSMAACEEESSSNNNSDSGDGPDPAALIASWTYNTYTLTFAEGDTFEFTDSYDLADIPKFSGTYAIGEPVKDSYGTNGTITFTVNDVTVGEYAGASYSAEGYLKGDFGFQWYILSTGDLKFYFTETSEDMYSYVGGIDQKWTKK